MSRVSYLTLLTPHSVGLEVGDPDLSVTGTGESIPWGVDAIFQYNGLLFNDRSIIDKIRVTSIEGIDDADVRDVREDNPVEDGETVYSAFYGGRTIVLNGRIEAFQRDKLRDLQEAIRNAFSDITREYPLYFLTGTPRKDHYINCKKNQSLKWTEEQKDAGTYFRDFQITLRASNPRFVRYRKTTLILDPDDSNTLEINNFGNFSAYPVITIFGGMTDIEFDLQYGISNVLTFKLNDFVVIDDTDWYKIDLEKRTVKDSNGVNQFDAIDDSVSDFFKIPAGASQLSVPPGKCNTTSINGLIRVEFRDSYM